MTKDERERLHEWMNRNEYYKQRLKEGNEDVMIFEARFNPNNQYVVFTDYDGEKSEYQCFLYMGKYCTSIKTSILEKYIVDVNKLNG